MRENGVFDLALINHTVQDEHAVCSTSTSTLASTSSHYRLRHGSTKRFGFCELIAVGMFLFPFGICLQLSFWRLHVEFEV